MTSVTKEFDLDNKVDLPSVITRVNLFNNSLLINPNGPSFILVNEEEESIFNNLLDNSINDVLEEIVTQKRVSRNEAIEIIKKILIRIDRFKFYNDTNIPCEKSTPELTLNITNNCNLKCIHCFQNAPSKSNLPIEILHNILDDYSNNIAEKSEITISGGEPLLHPNIVDVLDYCDTLGYEVGIFTNGLLLRKMYKKINDKVNIIQISLDGASQTINDEIRGKGTYEKIIDAIKLLYHDDIQIQISATILPMNIFDFKANIIKLMNTIDPDRKITLVLSPCFTAGRNDGQYSTTFFDLSIGFHDVINNMIELGWDPPKEDTYLMKRSKCAFGDSIIIDSNGDYKPCASPKSPIIGNIYNESLISLYSKAQLSAKAINVENIKSCNKCDLKYICAGGCYIESSIDSNNEIIPNCNYKHKYYYYSSIYNTIINNA